MEETKEIIKKINSTNVEARNSALDEAIKYIESSDIYLHSKDMNRFKQLLMGSDSPQTRILLEKITPIIDPKLLPLLEREGINEKELLEASCFYKQTKEILEDFIGPGNDYSVIDMCAGNCVAGAIWLMYGAKKAYFVDMNESKDSIKTRKFLESSHLEKKYDYITADLLRNSYTNELLDEINNSENAFIVSIHACGGLSDLVMKSAIEHKMAFAVAPCCHERNSAMLLVPKDTKASDYEPYFDDLGSFQDMNRVFYATSQGYNVTIRALPKEVTEKNRIIIGIPGEKNG